MPAADKKEDPGGRLDLGRVGARFAVSLENGRIVLDMRVPLTSTLTDWADGADAPRQRHATILFTDVSDSTRLARALEAEAYLDILKRLYALYHRVVARHGGTVAQISGDGMLALFGYPEAQEGDGRHAAEAALDLHAEIESLSGEELRLRLHSGIHAGVVLLQPGDQCRGRFELLGSATNIASRLCDCAAAGEILVSEATLGPERHLFETVAARRMQLRGAEQPVATLAVIGRAGSGRGAASAETRADLSGRDSAPASRRRVTRSEEQKLKALACELDAAADRMGASLDRAIEAARSALDPEREREFRARYEAEFSGSGDHLLAALGG